MMPRTYIAIDLKSFYASVECAHRGLDPMSVNLVVADERRTRKTICLAVSPSLKALGIPGRARLFEVDSKVSDVNADRLRHAPERAFTGYSADVRELERRPELSVDFVIAKPRMARYIEVSTQIYEIYLKYFAAEDMHVYSIDEVFIDYTSYADLYGCSARVFASRVIQEIQAETGVPAVAGIGTNLYLAKVALDIEAKHAPADAHGVRIAELDEMSYRKRLWEHRPLKDFWRVGRGISKRLESHGMECMGDVALCSVNNEDVLYGLFGKNAELLIDHAWGWEPCTIQDIRAYTPNGSSIGSGQVLKEPYSCGKARIVVREMADELALELVSKGLCADQVVLWIGYDAENLRDRTRASEYTGRVTEDFYGRPVPKSAHGSRSLGGFCASGSRFMDAASGVFDAIANPQLLIRRLQLTANHVVPEKACHDQPEGHQLDIFGELDKPQKAQLERERRMQETILALRDRFGNNVLIRGTSLDEGATAIERHRQIGGHEA